MTWRRRISQSASAGSACEMHIVHQRLHDFVTLERCVKRTCACSCKLPRRGRRPISLGRLDGAKHRGQNEPARGEKHGGVVVAHVAVAEPELQRQHSKVAWPEREGTRAPVEHAVPRRARWRRRRLEFARGPECTDGRGDAVYLDYSDACLTGVVRPGRKREDLIAPERVPSSRAGS
jgi:hypothetical protein